MKAFYAVAFLVLATPALAEKPELTVYAPDYFVSDWGPGPKVKAGFEAICDCTVKWVAGEVMPRLLLEGEHHTADVTIGLFADDTARARATGLFAPHGQDLAGLTMPVEWTDDTFLPFDWSELAFVYDETRLPNPPASFAELLESDVKIVLQDPRSSPSGLATLFWVRSIYGDDAPAAWAKLAPNVLTLTKGWSESYGMFTSGEVDMVLSFTTSPAYHIAAENDLTKHAAIFPEGHYLYVELAGRMASSQQPELADAFMAYMLSHDFQAMIPEANWSYPSKLADADLPQVFKDLPRPEKTLWFSEAEAEALRRPMLDEWLTSFAR
ncbi:MAG: thiamine ABC transporter substrate binding subunit [Paracoccus sp. (in: a-proteobacteria)]|uniref:thiamine ABC transporter substrate-binding protein n=1 Tax=Paracoccus sp. TaxID=267 RepID=UPI0026E02EBE|nr:thiamine ABC transporter substrate binding subunit [Paracoccus sp. (in: a-proteobacteria)]MDO5620225.1 thiamine ABC transporter substrate binding subunit [Paracoccus sp. (in: a-proteobacteria)]